MKFALNILIFAFAGCAVASAAGYAELRGEYAQALERIEAAEEKKIDELKQQYADTLGEGIVHYMRRGDLKSTLALRDERERFEAKGTIPPEIGGRRTEVGSRRSEIGRRRVDRPLTSDL